MRIELCGAGGISPVTINDFQTDLAAMIDKSSRTVDAFSDIIKFNYSMNGGIGKLSGAVDNLALRVQNEERKKQNLISLQKKTEAFCDLAKRTDDKVAALVQKNQNEFYKVNKWAKPCVSESTSSIISNIWDWLCGAGRSIVEAIKDTAKKIWNSIKSFYEGCNQMWRDWKKDQFWSKFSEEEYENIQEYLKKMDEPYKTIFDSNFYRFTMGNTSGSDTGYFRPSDNTVNVDLPAEPGNPRGPYVTFFHECGHAIDYNFNNDGDYYSLTYRDESGRSLQDVILKDVRNDIDKTVSTYVPGDEESKKRIVDYFMGARSVSIDTLTADEKRVVKMIQNNYSKRFAGAVNEAPSDIFGGVTNNLIVGDYAHRANTSKGETPESYGYWYDSSGNPTGAQSKEMWAEYYSYCATNDTDNLDALSTFLPESKAFLDKMAKDMK